MNKITIASTEKIFYVILRYVSKEWKLKYKSRTIGTTREIFKNCNIEYKAEYINNLIIEFINVNEDLLSFILLTGSINDY